MKLKTMSASKFIAIATAYFFISYIAIGSTSGYLFPFFAIAVGGMYLILWLSLVLLCILSDRVRYSLIFDRCLFFIQTIAILFNIPDSGSFRCRTKNFIQYLFDKSECGELWMSYEAYIPILVIYLVLTIALVAHMFWLRFGTERGRSMAREFGKARSN